MSAHTPGPWNALDSNNSNLVLVETDADNIIGAGIHIASCGVKNNRAAQANARLIAAAPDLLEELRKCIKLVDGEVPASAIAAIAKATGGA